MASGACPVVGEDFAGKIGESTKRHGDSWLRRLIRPVFGARAARFAEAPGHMHRQHFLDASQDKNVRSSHPNADALATRLFRSHQCAHTVQLFDTSYDVSVLIVPVVHILDIWHTA